MSKLQELINELCPDGVEFKRLGDIGNFYGGLSGKSKTDFTDGNRKFITYMNVYSNPSVKLEGLDKVKVGAGEKQNSIKYSDVLFTGSSETPNECGMSSVVTDLVEEEIYLNSFCFGFRLKNPTSFNPHFLKHLFRSDEVRKQIAKTASGVTRFNVSKARFANLEIPVPPLAVQEEIVKILDRFAEYTAELQAELQARKEQYEYYRNLLLTFNPSASGCGTDDEQQINVTTWGGHSYAITWKTMGEIGTFIRGNGLQKKDFTEAGVGCIHYGQIYTHYGTFADKTITCVSENFAKKLKKASRGDIVIATTSENVDDVCKAVAWLGNDEIAVSGDAYIFKHKQNPKYVAYFFQTDSFQKQKQPFVTGSKVMRVSGENMAKITIPIPPIDVQQRIVDILDRFETLVNDLTQGLPAEIEARKQQYEYYRNQLLTFQKLA